MQFPVYLQLGPLSLHPHRVFEVLAYFLGFRAYLGLRKRSGDFLPYSQRMWIVTAAIFGAALGSKILYWLVDPMTTLRNWNNPYYLMGGKTIVGGLMGGWIAVEGIKRYLKITQSTGDLFAIPLAVGTAIGRVGCFLSGIEDHTYGTPTQLPWGVDFGDGMLRHPTQLYEIVWLGFLTLYLFRMTQRPHRKGDLFKGFMVGYLGFRLLCGFLSPTVRFAGLSAIQWTCLAALLYYRRDFPYLLRLRRVQADG